jgi:elongation factor 1-beta
MAFSLDAPLAFHILNGFFESQSYVKGVQASDDDKTVFSALHEGPDPTTYPHLARWYDHIAATQGLTKKAIADDIDLWGSDDEEVNEEAEKLKQQRLDEYAAKKAKGPVTIAKTMVTLDVKPWDDETDLKKMLSSVRSVEQDGLTWAEKESFVAVGYGIQKLRINLVVEDDKVSVEELQEKLATDFEDLIQSVDIVAMSKL